MASVLAQTVRDLEVIVVDDAGPGAVQVPPDPRIRRAELTAGYDTSLALCNTHRAAIDGLRELERDLHEHIHEENNILFARVLTPA